MLGTVTGDPQTQAQMRNTIANLDAVMQKANALLGQLGGTSSPKSAFAFCMTASRFAIVLRIWACVCGSPVTVRRSFVSAASVAVVSAMFCVVERTFCFSRGSVASDSSAVIDLLSARAVELN